MAGLDGIITFKSAEYRPCYVKGRKALFHRWIDKDTPILKVNAFLSQKSLDRISDKVKRGVIPECGGEVVMQKCVLGLVEYEDGTVAEVEPSEIAFADRKVDQYGFEKGEQNV